MNHTERLIGLYPETRMAVAVAVFVVVVVVIVDVYVV